MFKSILLPIDLGHSSSWDKTAPAAVDMAKHYSGKIHVVSVIPEYGMPIVGSYFPGNYTQEVLESTTKDLKKKVDELIPAEFLADTRVIFGTIYKEIITAADELECDLIVVSSHRSEMSDYLLGTNAAKIVRHAKQSVFVVR